MSQIDTRPYSKIVLRPNRFIKESTYLETIKVSTNFKSGLISNPIHITAYKTIFAQKYAPLNKTYSSKQSETCWALIKILVKFLKQNQKK